MNLNRHFKSAALVIFFPSIIILSFTHVIVNIYILGFGRSDYESVEDAKKGGYEYGYYLAGKYLDIYTFISFIIYLLIIWLLNK